MTESDKSPEEKIRGMEDKAVASASDVHAPLEMQPVGAPQKGFSACASSSAEKSETEKDAKPEAADDYHELDFSKIVDKSKKAAESLTDDIALNEHIGRWKMTLSILTVASVLMSLSYTMLIPFLPMYLMQELDVAKSDVNVWSGLIFSVSFIVSGVMAPIWGAMADKRSKKLMAVRSAVLLAVSYGLSGLVQNEWQLLAVRTFQGFAAGLWPACLAILSASIPKEKLGLSLGIMQGGMTAGGVLGPLIGGVLAEAFGMRMTFFLGSAALTVISLMIIFFIKEPPKRKAAEAKAGQPPKKKTNLLRIPVIQRLLFTAGVVQMTILLQQPVMPLYVAELQGSMDRIVFVTGLLFSIVGISGVIASPLWGIIGQRIGFRPALYIALLGTAIFGMIQAIPDTLIPFGTWRFIGGLTFAGIFPAINALLTNNTEPEDRGRIFGLSFSAQQIGSVLGPVLGGAMAMVWSIKLVVFVSGFVLIPLVVFLYLRRPAVETSMSGVEVKFDRFGKRD